MPNMLEIQVMQKERLYELLILERKNADSKVKGLGFLINKTKSGMNKEDIAFVEQLVANEKDIDNAL